MGLVDYDSDSASEVEPATDPEPTPKPSSQASSKKPFQKVVHRSNPGKVFVSLPTQASSTNNSNSNSNSNGDEPPAKRARTTGGGLFSGFNSFLPAPKNTGKQAIKPSTSNTTRPGVKLKTSAAPGFSRDVDEDDTMQQFAAPTSISDLPSGGLSLPPPKRQESAPSIPEGQTPAEEVKLVGKQPLMFRPLSVGMNAKKKNKNKPGPASTTQPPASNATPALSTPAVPSEPAPETKVSLFSMHTEEPSYPVPTTSSANNGAYEPLFETAYEADPASAGSSVPVEKQYDTLLPTNAAGASESLDNMADDLNLSAAARRELFGRDGSNFAAKKVVNFNMDREYRHNEDVRASGDQQTHNPVRALQSGKHSLKQLVQNVQNQKDALEDSFAKGRSNRKEASSRYGW
ncbi:hypothetical protein C2857_001244 [Epichloe festucae Fl1]|uniref:Stress activated map kinase interacting n=1 Tax=Epichloe festucae (strain Fl1) TaxID=877507 RepID=A0A7U3Q1C4_EPIFF|nr:hypothetical protein C2857_001244 [Epichloe festucae Fl1]